MSIDELKDCRPHSLGVVDPGTDQVKGMADRDKTEATFHCGRVVNTSMERIGSNPGEELRLEQTNGLFPCALVRLSCDQTQDDELLESGRFPNAAHVAIGISLAIRD